MSGFLNDLRFGLRQLAAKPGFAAAAILTLALGIGANTAVFSVLNGYLFKPLPYPHGEQLTRVGVDFKATGGGYFSMSIPLYQLIRKDTTAFSGMAIYNYKNVNAEIGDASSRIPTVVATASLFKVLGVTPALGRVFDRTATEPGKGGVAIISDNLWRSRFGASPDVIGKAIRLNGMPVHIIGVMPRGFAFPSKGIDVWMPMTIAPADRAADRMFELSPLFIGRLKTGVRLEALQTQLNAVRSHVGRVVSADAWQQVTHAGFTVHAKSYRQSLVGDRVSTVLLLQGAVLMVLLLTCVNVANLLLSRVLGRSHEIAMRSALGASRSALARQLLVESFWLAVPGGGLGLLLGWLGMRFFATRGWGGSSSLFSASIDWHVGLAALVMACITAALTSVLPIRHLAKTDLQSLLQEGGRGSAGSVGAKRVRGALAATELVLATALIAVSGLLLHSFVNLQSVNPGFRKNNLLIAGLLVPANDHAGDVALTDLYRGILGKVRVMPGVKAAGVARWAPFGHSSWNSTFDIRGREPAPGNTKPEAWLNAASSGYFRALGLPILRGRNFDARDSAGGRPVAIVDANFVRKYFASTDPLGQQIKSDKTWRTIIGVVPAVKAEELTETDHAAVYLPAAQAPVREIQLVVQTLISPDQLSESLRKAIAAVDPAIAVYGIESMHVRLTRSLQDRQTTMTLLLAFGGIALALAVVGVYGVLSYAVGQRVGECGVRLALGALPGDVLWLIIRDGLKLLVTGLVCGLLLAVIFGYLLSSRLFGVLPFDPLTLAGTAVVLSVITLAACYLPARRAARLDPSVAMVEQ